MKDKNVNPYNLQPNICVVASLMSLVKTFPMSLDFVNIQEVTEAVESGEKLSKKVNISWKLNFKWTSMNQFDLAYIIYHMFLFDLSL